MLIRQNQFNIVKNTHDMQDFVAGQNIAEALLGVVPHTSGHLLVEGPLGKVVEMDMLEQLPGLGRQRRLVKKTTCHDCN